MLGHRKKSIYWHPGMREMVSSGMEEYMMLKSGMEKGGGKMSP